jgi:hypothetical protein
MPDDTTTFNGLGTHLGNLSRLSDAESRSINAENPDGAPGGGARATIGDTANAARDLGPGWKVAPCITLPAGERTTLADITGPGAIQHLWITVNLRHWRTIILRCFWDDEPEPSIEVPLGDFFASGWNQFAQVSSVPVAVNPTGGLNSYWEMPFRKRAVITVENLTDEPIDGFFYQIDYTLTEVPADRAYLHAQFRRSNPLPDREVHTLLDGVSGRGQYVGTYIAWGSNHNGWWGEGEVKFYLDSDQEFPTICGTGTEDYFGGAWAFENGRGGYDTFSTPYLGFHQVVPRDETHTAQRRFGMYRWHVPDPIRFRSRLRVTIQALGWRSGGRFLSLRDDISSVSFWYQTEPHASFPQLPTKDDLEIT